MTDLDAAVTEQDVIAIFPPIAGGTHPCASPVGEGRRRTYGWLV